MRKTDGKVGEEAKKLVSKWKEIAKKQVEEQEALEKKSGVGNSDQSPSPVHSTPSPTTKPIKPESKNVDEKVPYESTSKSKVHLITIKREESVNKKRKHSEDGERKSKKEKHLKLETQSTLILDNPLKVDTTEQEPCACLENNIDVGSSKRDKKKKKSENERKTHKKSHEKRHHKSSKHKEEKLHRDRKHHQEDENQSQHHLEDENLESHKHKRLKKSKTKDKDENRVKKSRKTSEESLDANAASRDVNASNEVPGE